MSLAWLTACLSVYERCPLVEVQLYFLFTGRQLLLLLPYISRNIIWRQNNLSKNSRNIYFLLTSFIDFPTNFYANLFLTPNLFSLMKRKFDTVNSVLGYARHAFYSKQRVWQVTNSTLWNILLSYIAGFSLLFMLRFWIVTDFRLQTNAVSG